MDIELRLRELHAVHDPGVHVTEAVMARVGEPAGSELSSTRVVRLSDARERRRRHYILITIAMAIAAAAALLVLNSDRVSAPQLAAARTVPTLTAPAAPEPVAPPAALASVPDPVHVPAQPEVPSVAPLHDLPLFPPRPRAISAATEEQALQKAVERHPELVEGPDTDSVFNVVLFMRRNGSVISSAARLVQRSDLGAIVSEMSRLVPQDLGPGGAGIRGGSRRKHSLLPDGRALRTDVTFDLTVVADDYEVADTSEGASRSSLKVEQLVRARYPELLLPSGGAEVNRLTILLTEDGQIERDNVELVRSADLENAARMPEMPRTAAEAGQMVEKLVAATSQSIANRLGIEVDRIGQIGNLRVQEGINGVTDDVNGVLRPFGQSRSLLVVYVWPRRAGETGPSMAGRSKAQIAQGLHQELEQNEKRLAPAVTIVERLMPQAFTLPNSDAGTPLVALTARGEAIGAIRLNTRGREQPGPTGINKALQQINPDLQRWSVYATETLKSETGATAQVIFVWLAEEPATVTTGE